MRNSSYEGHRRERYFVKLLNKNDEEIRILDTSSGGSINLDNAALIKGGGNITLTNETPINWEAHRIQPWFEIEGVGSWPLGVFIPTVPGRDVTSNSVIVTLDLHDKLMIMDEDSVDKYYNIGRNAVITTAINLLILSTGQTKIHLTPSTAVAKEAMVWAAGTSKLEIINYLLKYINYEPLSVDGYGVYQVKPYMLPSARPIIRTFQKGATAIHTSIWKQTQDIASIPNKVILLAEGSSEFEGLTGSSQITDPNSPYSYESRGRWVVHTETGIAAESPSAITELAKRRLVELMSPTSSIDISHAMVPLALGDTVRFITETEHGPVDKIATVERMQFTLTPGSLCQALWQEVVTSV